MQILAAVAWIVGAGFVVAGLRRGHVTRGRGTVLAQHEQHLIIAFEATPRRQPWIGLVAVTGQSMAGGQQVSVRFDRNDLNRLRIGPYVPEHFAPQWLAYAGAALLAILGMLVLIVAPA